jgi:predicted MFS family arabinose efflux permease
MNPPIDRHITDGKPRTVACLGLAQTLAWASSYYLPAMLATSMARDLGISTPLVFAGFSVALLVSAVLGPLAGKAIDRYGGRPILMLNSLVFALGLTALALAQGPVGMFVAWGILGVAMAAGLYEAAFATLVHLYGQRSRGAITGITLVAGFASTIGWPLSAWLELAWGWRSACLTWAGLHVFLGLPLYSVLSKTPHQEEPDNTDGGTQATFMTAAASTAATANATRSAVLLALTFAITWFISTGMAAHLPRLLQAEGVPLATALLLVALVGPAQVAGRLLEYGLLRRVHPVVSARVAGALHSVGALAFLLVGVPAGAAFTLLHGAGNGVLTIAKGTLPLVLFGAKDYGLRQGILMVPARFAQALSPYLFGLAIDRYGAGALWFSAALGGVGFAALMLLPGPGKTRPQAAT